MARRSVWVLVAVLVISLVSAQSAPARGAPPPTSAPTTTTDPADAQEAVLVLFWGDGCPHCKAERELLDDLRDDYPELVIEEYEVYNDEANRRLFREQADEAGIEISAVPTTFFAGRVWVGYTDRIGDEIRAEVEALLGTGPAPVERTVVDVPFVGAVDVGSRSLVISTVIIGFVDGINPCSLWVLSILLALVLHSGSRRRVIVVGGVFLLVTTSMYGLYIAGAYSVIAYARFLPWIQRAVAVVVGAMGILQLKDAAGYKGGPSLSVPDSAKPGLYTRMRGLAASDQGLGTVLGATAVLAVGVSLIETPCTLGLPLLWTNLLNQNDVAPLGAALLFLLYMTAFLIDELLVFGAAVITMRALKMQEHHGRALKLISGVVMVTLAGVMLVRPEVMESISGTLAVFGAAAVIAGVVILLARARRVAV